MTAFLANLTEKGEEGRCPTCSHGPVQVSTSDLVLSTLLLTTVQESDLLEVVRSRQEHNLNDVDAPSSTVTLRRNDFRSSTKLDALLQNLSE